MDAADLAVRAAPDLAKRLDGLLGARALFFAGLPGTGKSLLLHQIAHLAHARGRVIHLLQWDVVRPVFEATAAGQKYPMVGGVTHGVIRKAAGIWARRAVPAWEGGHPRPEHLLLGEVPLVGNRFVELVRPSDDAAERWLGSPAYRFVLPVPTRAVRTFLEAERERRAHSPLHEREREDAPPPVLRALWRELVHVAGALTSPGGGTGVGDDASTAVLAAATSGDPTVPPWDPRVYQHVYGSVLRHRRVEVVVLETVLPTSALSVYRFTVPAHDLVPCPADAGAVIAEVEGAYPELGTLQQEIARWWDV